MFGNYPYSAWHAAVWSGTSDSWVDLDPTGFYSHAYGVDAGQVVGSGYSAAYSGEHALLWNRSGAEWNRVDLNPTRLSTPADESRALAVHGGQQVGEAAWNGNSPLGGRYAMLWNGSAESFVNLHEFLPDLYSASVANGIWHDAGATYVVGRALNMYTGNYEAVMWVSEPENRAPVATNDAYTTNEDIALVVDAPGVLGNDTDADGDPLSAVLVDGPFHGTITLDVDGSFTYTPDANVNGSDSFTYLANDGTVNGNVATVSITVTPVNDAPSAANDTEAAVFNTAVTIAVLSNDTDIDGDPLTVTGVSQPADGTATIDAGGTVTYTPRNGFTGTDSFTYSISDGAGGVASASVTVTVSRQNRPPQAVLDVVFTDRNVAITFDPVANDRDPDGDPLTLEWVTQPSFGSVVINGDGTVTFTPQSGFRGHDTFTYLISDGRGGTDVGRVRVFVH